MTYLSVCSGIEAASVAWEPLGFEPVAFAEINKFPSAVLAHRFPHVPNLGDFTEIDNVECDVLVGGTPCQSFSVAGLRGGMADERGNLALGFIRLAQRLRLRWVVWENVPGVLSSNGGRDFGTFLGGLGECGYGFAYRILDAQYFGVPQRRRRVFVVGYLGDWRRAAAVLFERHSLQGHPAPRRETGQRVANAITERPDRGGGNSEGQRLIAHALRADGFDASEDGTGRGTPLVPVAYQCHGSNVGSMGHLRAGNGNEAGGVPFVTAFAQNQRDEVRTMEVAGALAGEPGMKQQTYIAHAIQERAVSENPDNGPQGKGWQEEAAFTLEARHHVQAVQAVRRLTPRECERLQGFPDDWTLVPYRGKPASDGPRYKAIGNSMAVPVMRWIGERLRTNT